MPLAILGKVIDSDVGVAEGFVTLAVELPLSETPIVPTRFVISTVML